MDFQPDLVNLWYFKLKIVENSLVSLFQDISKSSSIGMQSSPRQSPRLVSRSDSIPQRRGNIKGTVKTLV